MPPDPLLPHAGLRALRALMLRCRGLERKQRGSAAAREGLLAGTSIQLGRGDLLSAAPGDPVAPHLAPEGKGTAKSGLLFSEPTRSGRLPTERLLGCAAAARGMQAAGTDRLVLAFAHAGDAGQDWQAALDWAQREQLPLILACGDATGGVRPQRGRPPQHAFDFGTVSAFTRRAKLPMFPVDGEDAVAVYRVMQECALRARSGGGPAALWAVLTPVRAGVPKLKRSASPLARLERSMAARGIPLA